MPRGINAYDEARLQNRLWTPDVLRGNGKLLAWYDVSDESTITLSSGRISQLRDKSGFGRHLAPTANGPTYTQRAIGERAAGLYASNETLFCTLAATYAATTLAAIVVATVTLPISAAYEGLVCLTGSTSNDANQAANCVLHSDGVNAGIQLTRANNSALPQSAVAGDRAFTAGMRFDGTNKQSSLNGTLGTASGSSGSFGVERFRFGARFNNTEPDTFWKGLIGEMFVMSSLSLREWQAAEAYAAWRWINLNDFSGPYKNRPPLVED